MNVQRLNALLSMELPTLTPKAAPAAPAEEQGPNFAEVLRGALGSVEKDQNDAKEVAAKLATGQVKDISEVMIASERANLSLGLAIQVRNKLLEAYQDIMRMPL
ncbi:MAG TPA: flagellar hook-basal body complex protein FliE [Candidatus Sulfotelmatobacter sp.]|nr:flagellar hook-basal body complex protein FliE [Candidatus Sulfotelmatobacter sp.]HWI65930.1 flagellar hook-basal body complex protein FliE [Symbiobacteriaceae bacterium]